MLSALNAMTSCFYTNEPDLFIFQKGMKDANGVAATADTSNYSIRQTFWPVVTITHLVQCFAANHTLKIAYHGRIGMRAEGAAQQVMGCTYIGYPIANRFVDGILEGFTATFHATYIGTQQFHAKDIGL